jgi:hypothetical protein
VLGGCAGEAVEQGVDGWLVLAVGGGGREYLAGRRAGGVQGADRQVGSGSGGGESGDERDSVSGRDESLLAHPAAAVHADVRGEPGAGAGRAEYVCRGGMVFYPGLAGEFGEPDGGLAGEPVRGGQGQ